MNNTQALKLAQDAFEASTAYVDTNYRKDWDYSIKAFNSEHAAGSKYLSPEYAARSRIFHPMTRAIERKNEAAAAMALCSNMETVDLTPGNPDSMLSVASAACMKQILEYRLQKSIRYFQVVMGAMQDAQVTGTVCSYNYWEYEVRGGKKIKDKPCIELRPIENIRLDAAANWLDPVNTSPYFCDIVPMYVCDVRAMMDSKDDKTGKPKWKKFDDKKILQARPDIIDSTRQARLGRQENPELSTTQINAFDIVWVLRWFMRDSQGYDQHFYTLGTVDLLSEVMPVEQQYFHGRRPYTIGCAVLETHKALKPPLPVLIRPLQQGINTVGNSRFDNVQLVLNKRYYVARGRQVDHASLLRNAPGAVTMMTDPKTDVVEANWPDVTSSSYVEHDRMKAEADDLVGNFSPNTRVANHGMNDTLGGAKLATQSAGVMTDYLIMTVINSWLEPTLEQLVLLEQHYETDEVVLGICAQKARLFPRFGMSQITDEMLAAEVNLSVNVGMGAANPGERFQRFIVATKAAIELVNTAPPGFNVIEGVKEIYANAGYRDGARFFSGEQDPRLLKAMQMVQQLGQALKGKGLELQAQNQIKALQIQSDEKQKLWQLGVDDKRITADMQLRSRELDIQAADAETKRLGTLKPELAEPVDPRMADAELAEKLAHTDLQLAQAEKARADAAVVQVTGAMQGETLQANKDKAVAEKDKAVYEAQAAALPVKEALDQVDVSAQLQNIAQAVANMGGVSQTVNVLGGRVDQLGTQLQDMLKGLHGLTGVVLQPKRQPVRVTGGKKEGKIVVHFDNGETQEVAVN